MGVQLVMSDAARVASGKCCHLPWVLKEDEEPADVGGEALQADHKADQRPGELGALWWLRTSVWVYPARSNPRIFLKAFIYLLERVKESA